MLILKINSWCIPCEAAFRRLSLDLADAKFAVSDNGLVPSVLAQTYVTYGVTRPQCINFFATSVYSLLYNPGFWLAIKLVLHHLECSYPVTCNSCFIILVAQTVTGAPYNRSYFLPIKLHRWRFYPRSVLASGYCRCLRLCVCVRVCVNYDHACAIIHHPFKLDHQIRNRGVK